MSPNNTALNKEYFYAFHLHFVCEHATNAFQRTDYLIRANKKQRTEVRTDSFAKVLLFPNALYVQLALNFVKLPQNAELMQ